MEWTTRAMFFIFVYCLLTSIISDISSVQSGGGASTFSKNELPLASVVSQNSFRLISNNSFFDIRLWGSRLQFVLEGATNISNAVEFTLLDMDHSQSGDYLRKMAKIVPSPFIEHFVVISCSTPAQFQNLMDTQLGRFFQKMDGSATFLIFANQSVIHDLAPIANQTDFGFMNLNSGVYIITLNNNNNFSMFEIYTLPKLGNHLIVNQLISTESSSKHPIQEIRRKWGRRRKMLDSVQITAIAVANEPQTKYIVVNGNVILTSGIGTNIFYFLRDALHFDYKVIVETIWPKQAENGSWIGMGQTLMEGKADIIIVLTTYLPSRAAAFTIAHPHLNNALVAVFLQPTVLVRNVYLSPFKPTLWCSVLGFVLGTFVSFRVIVFHVKHFLTWREDEKRHGSLTCSDSLMWVMSGICKQGWIFWRDTNATGNTSALKIIACVILPCTTLIIFNYFGAFLYKFLSAEEIPIKSLENLIQSDLYLVADNSSQTVLNLLLHPETVKWESEDTAKIISKKKILIKNPKFVKSDIISGFGAFVTYPTTVTLENAVSWRDPGSGKDLCDTGKRLSVMPFSIPYAAGMLMPKGSIYKDLFNIQIIILMESGLMKKYSKDFDLMRPRCLNPRDILFGSNVPNLSTISLSVTDLLTAFVILIVGMGLCLVVYCACHLAIKLACYG